MSLRASILGLVLLLGAIAPALANSGCPTGHDCCPPDQQMPCGRNSTR